MSDIKNFKVGATILNVKDETARNGLAGKQDIIQYSTMPAASASNVGKIVQYVGTTNSNYTNGYYYQCTASGGSYSWVRKDVQPGGSGGAAVWGGITGTLANQTDLQDALNGKGTYTKPSGGIPKTDLASDVQTSLGKADSALQSHQSLAAYRTSSQQDVIDATKAGKASNPTAGHLASLDANGNVTDSGVSADDLETFIVNFTIDPSAAQITACDKTFAEIAAAWTAGRHIVAMTNIGVQLVLTGIVESGAYFSEASGLSEAGYTGLSGIILIAISSSNIYDLSIRPFPQVPSSHTANHLTAFDANGNLLDVGVTADDLKEFAVNITATMDAEGNITITSADKTYAQILAAVTAKRHVVAYLTVTVGGVSLVYQAPYTALSYAAEIIFCSTSSNLDTVGLYVDSADDWTITHTTIMEKVSGTHTNEIGIINSDGNVTFSGKTMADIIGTTATTLPATAVNKTLYDLGVQSSLAIVLPGTGGLGDWIVVNFLSGSTPTTLSITSSAGLSSYDLVPSANKIYELYFEWIKIDASNYGWAIKYAEFERAV